MIIVLNHKIVYIFALIKMQCVDVEIYTAACGAPDVPLPHSRVLGGTMLWS